MSFTLQCAVCQNQLTQPVTLPCGFTICLSCLPSQEAFEQLMFVCPVKQCKEDSHLFGPSLYLDTMISKLCKIDMHAACTEQQQHQQVDSIKDILQCPMDHHLVEHPITNHCGHTFCRLCLLRHKLSNDACSLCEERLPSYQYLQKQPTNHILSSISSVLGADTRYSGSSSDAVAKSSPVGNKKIQLMQAPHDSSVIYTNIPINIMEFPILPYQKLRIPIYTEDQRSSFLQSLLSCQDYQYLCFGVLSKQQQQENSVSTSSRKGQLGTIVKVKSVDQRSDSLVIDIQGLDRFEVVAVHNEYDDLVHADIQLKLESQVNLISPMTGPTKQHWVDQLESMNMQWKENKGQQQKQASNFNDSAKKDYLSPTASPGVEQQATVVDFSLISHHQGVDRIIRPTSPPNDSFLSVNASSTATTPSATAIKLSSCIHDFISDLAYSTPTTSFRSAVDGLLGPVWLDSVQGLHGALPSAFNPVAMCWWSAIVLPVSNSERYHLLETNALEDRLQIVLSWIQDLKSQWVNCRTTATNTVAKVCQQQ